MLWRLARTVLVCKSLNISNKADSLVFKLRFIDVEKISRVIVDVYPTIKSEVLLHFRTYRVRQRIGRFLSVKKKLIYWISWYSYNYRKVHTLAFAEISESVVLKYNTEQKKTQYIIPLVTSSRCPPLRCSHSANRSWTLLMALCNTSTGILEISSCIRSENPSVKYAWHCFLTVPVSWNDPQPTGEDFVRMMLPQLQCSVGCELF